MKKDGHRNIYSKRLLDIKIKMKLTQKELASYLGVAESTIHAMIYYNKQLKPSMLQLIHSKFDIDLTNDNYLEYTVEDILHKKQTKEQLMQLNTLRKQFVLTFMYFKKWGINELSKAMHISSNQVRYIFKNEQTNITYNFIKLFYNLTKIDIT